MTAALLHFTPRAELDGQTNLDAFIALCRNSPELRANEQFESNVWELGRTLKGKNHEQRVIFSTMEAAKTQARFPVMPEPYLSFAKAVLVYMQDQKPVKSPAFRLSALRFLEAGLRGCGKDKRPTAVDTIVLDTAVELAKRHVTMDVAYRVAGQLEAIADLMREMRFITMTTRWLHSLARPDSLGSRISKAAIEAREEKLPSAAVLRGLGGVFQLVQGIPDTIVSSAAALMVCAPERVNEVMRLERNCIVEADGRFTGKVGIRWPGSKGADDTAKWLPSEMVGVAKEAVLRLRESTHAAHKLAVWYDANPTSVYLHEGAEYLRHRDFLTYAEIALILWGSEGRAASAKPWCRQRKLQPVEPQSGLDREKVRFAEVEEAVIAMQPPTFPNLPGDSTVKYRNALCVIRKNELHASRGTYMCVIDLLEQGDIANRLGQRNDSGIPSLFAKYDFTEDDGSPIVVNSHQFRHYLNTLAQMGGLSQTEIAIFSGRKDFKQNSAYDHLTSEQAQRPISTAIKVHGFTSHLVQVPLRSLVNRDDFRSIGGPAAHTTEYGYCVHNFASEPCQMHRDCVNCPEQVCIKGEAHKEANLRRLREETQYLLKEARAAMADEEYGADLWVKHQEMTLERLEALLAVLEDPATVVGATVQLNLDNVPLPVGHTVTEAVKAISTRRKALT